MRSLKAGSAQKISREDCNSVLINSHNMITPADLAKFQKFRSGQSIG